MRVPPPTPVSRLAAMVSAANAATFGRGDTGVMRFLFRLAFWLGLVLVLLPSVGSNTMPKTDVGATDAVSAARAAIADLRQFCERQPEACNIGSQAAVAIGHRAQAGAKMLYEFLNDR